MPVKGSAKTGSEPSFRTTDKSVQAEMKNKVELARLQLCVRILDRQKLYNAFTIEKDKRQALAALARMRTTSGLSMHGLAPEGAGDRKHEDSPYFQSYRPLSEKRLVRWRVQERELQRMLDKDEEILTLPWERDPEEDASQRLDKLMRSLGYDVDVDDTRRSTPERLVTSSSDNVVNGLQRRRRVDPFECLKEDCPQTEDEVIGFNLLKPKRFSIDVWSRQVVENYKQSVSGSTVRMRVKSANARLDDDDKESKSVTKSKTVRTSSVYGNRVKKERSARPSQATIRPHTASGLTRFKRSRETRITRPSSADQAKTSAKRRSLERNSNENNRLNIVDETEPEVSEGEQSAGAANDDDDDDDDDVDRLNETRISQDELDCGCETVHSEVERSTEGGKVERTTQVKESNFLFTTLLHADPKRQRGAEKANFVNEKSEDGVQKMPKRVKSVQHLVRLAKEGTELENYDMKALEENLEDISGLKKGHQVHDLFKRMPEIREKRTNKQLHITKAERRIALHSDRQRKRQGNPLDIVLEGGDDHPEGGQLSDVCEEDFVRRLPQWKRELMAEAPPGLFGPRSPAKVVVAMSKAQRRRELDALVRDNVSNVRKIINQENARRIRDRLHIYLTMRKLNEAAEKTAGTIKPRKELRSVNS